MTFAIGLFFIGASLYFARKAFVSSLYDAMIRESIRRRIEIEEREALERHHVMFFDQSEIWSEKKEEAV